MIKKRYCKYLEKVTYLDDVKDKNRFIFKNKESEEILKEILKEINKWKN